VDLLKADPRFQTKKRQKLLKEIEGYTLTTGSKTWWKALEETVERSQDRPVRDPSDILRGALLAGGALLVGEAILEIVGDRFGSPILQTDTALAWICP